jgi:hypothetical protein
MGRRRHVPPDPDRIAERFGIQPASEDAGKRAYLVARALGTANNIASWDPETWKEGDWICGTSGLSDRDKLCWRLIAAASGAL